MSQNPTVIAFVPARSGSQRVKQKNIRMFNGKPLLAHTLGPALQSGIFARVLVSTDSSEVALIAERHGGEIIELRPEELSQSHSRDIEWVQHMFGVLDKKNVSFDAFAILRPTSPFRTVQTLQRAWTQFKNRSDIDSMRAVERCAQHPGKMWVQDQYGLLQCLLPESVEKEWHSTPYQSLPVVYVQNASLEMAWKKTVVTHGSISGQTILPFFTEPREGFDINTSQDWYLAEAMASGVLLVS